MRRYSFAEFGLDQLRLDDVASPTPGPGEVLVDVQAVSLNYRDLLVVTGGYNPKLALPATPLSDGAGAVLAVGAGVTRIREGDRVISHFVAPWIDGPYQVEFNRETLGTPGPGLAAEQVVLPADAVVPIPHDMPFSHAATLPIAALTAWSCLQTVANVGPGQTVLTLGTGGVSIFALQLAKALGARVIITSSSDDKLARCRELGADETVNYQTHPDWEQQVLELTGGAGVDVTVDTGGPGTLNHSMRATRAGGTIALPGALTGRSGEIMTGLILVRRLHIAGIMVDSRAKLEQLVAFIDQHRLEPVISDTYAFDQLPEALRHMQSGGHFGKIVLAR